MLKSFNLTGPCSAARHYLIPASRRLGDEILDLVEEGRYFLLRAPRQSGKTTLMLDLVDRINGQGKQYAMYCSLEALKTAKDSQTGLRSLIWKIKQSAARDGLPNSELLDRDFGDPSDALYSALSEYCKSLDKPLTILFDEADALSGDFFIDVLSQIREGYIRKEKVPFVHSIALVGMRDLSDFRYDPNDPDSTVGNTSPFNIASQLVLRDFTPGEVAELYGQHTAQTGQPFTKEAVEIAFSMTQGQPWLVNAIGDHAVKSTASDPDTPITGQMVMDAAQSIILSRVVHISSLERRLKEERVQVILEPLIIGDFIEDSFGDGYNYAIDLGLIRNDGDGTRFANPIYGEVILRTLTGSIQKKIRARYPNLVLSKFISDEEVQVDDLLTEFVRFWRENSEIWTDSDKYREAAPLLVMQAFMQRIVSGGAMLTRECAEGRDRVDLGIFFNGNKYPIELKIRRKQASKNIAVRQVIGCMDRMGVKNGWVVLFNQNKTASWEDKIWVQTREIAGKTIRIYGC